MDVQLILDFVLIFFLYASLRPICKLLIYRFNVHVTAVYGIATVLAFVTLLSKKNGFVSSNIEAVLIPYFIYAWWIEKRLSSYQNN